jgi:thiamine pyrophosphate-dependent acetolactate synthase large subunit-like protein
VTALSPGAHYEQLCVAFGGAGHLCSTPEQVRAALDAALLNTRTPTVINVLIATASAAKPQSHSALNLARRVGAAADSPATASAAAAPLRSKL